MSVVELSQPLQALEVANRVRYYRADVKREIGALPTAEGLRAVADKLDDPGFASMRLYELLGSVRRVGVTKIDRICRDADLYPAKRLGSLTVRQIAILRRVLGGGSLAR